MQIVRFLIVLISCLGIASAGLAAMPCCKEKPEETQQQMPCHPSADTADEAQVDMGGSCNCMCSTQVAPVVAAPSMLREAVSVAFIFKAPPAIFSPPSRIENPPKRLS